MKLHPLHLFLVLAGLAVVLCGCTSFEAQVERGRSLAGIRRFFVVSNLNDNHALDHHIAAALRARGFEAGTGPMTMMPDDAQAIVTFQDNWGWDFGNHLAFLKVTVSDARTSQPFCIVTFSPRIPSGKSLPDIVDLMVDRLFVQAKR